MGLNYITIIFTVINFAILVAIIIGIYKAIQGFKSFVDRNKKMDKKIDLILNKLENKDDNWYLLENMVRLKGEALYGYYCCNWRGRHKRFRNI